MEDINEVKNPQLHDEYPPMHKDHIVAKNFRLTMMPMKSKETKHSDRQVGEDRYLDLGQSSHPSEGVPRLQGLFLEKT